MPRFRTRPALLAGLTLVLACSHDTTGADTKDIARHLQRWNAQGLTSYTFEFRRSSQVYYEPAVVEVRDGSVARVTSLLTGQPIPADWARQYPTIDQEFDAITAIARAGGDPEVSWDETLGYPTHLADRNVNIPDASWQDSIAAVRPVPPGS